MGKVSIKLKSSDIAKLEKELERLNAIRFDTVLKNNLIQILSMDIEPEMVDLCKDSIF